MTGMCYLGIGPEEGKVIEEEQAYEYAMERCFHGTLEEQKEFKEMLVEWYYSGNFIKVQEEQDGSSSEYL